MNTKLFVLFVIFFAYTLTCGEPKEAIRRRLRIERQQGFAKITDQQVNRRRAQSVSWRPLKIFFDTTSLMSDLRRQNASSRVNFYKKVFEITGNWWGQALKVNDNRSKIAKTIASYHSGGRYKRELGFQMGGESQSKYDLLIRVFLCPNQGNALAYAGPFLRHPDTQRPITGTVCVLPYGDQNFRKAKYGINRAVGTIIHEFGHIISFISWQKFQSKNLKVDNSINRFLWIGPKVKEVAQKFYGCSNCKGIPLQNDNGKLGGHWSEYFLATELMTPVTGADPELVSPMTLALCEDSGWYKADYSFTENYAYHKGEGCKFTKSCPKPICKAGTSGFITSDFKGVGYCQSDSNGCAKESMYSNRNCMNGGTWSSDYLKYGASYGGNCVIVQGKFKRAAGGYIYSQSRLSVQAQCSNSRRSYTLTFKNAEKNSRGQTTGDAHVTCTQAGTEKFNTRYKYPSEVKCVDPKNFCDKRFGKNGFAKCDDTCVQNGRCQRVANNPYRIRRDLQSVGGSNASWCLNHGFIRDASKTPAKKTPTKKYSAPTTKKGQGSFTISRSSFGTSTSGSTWQCWCYKDGRRRTVCPNLPEDRQ